MTDPRDALRSGYEALRLTWTTSRLSLALLAVLAYFAFDDASMAVACLAALLLVVAAPAAIERLMKR